MKIIFKNKAKRSLQKYFTSYLSYYENLYEDCGVWNEKQILDGCKKEAKERLDDIVETIKNHLQNEFITYPNNETLIRWKTKIIIAKVFDEEDVRVVEDLEIR